MGMKARKRKTAEERVIEAAVAQAKWIMRDYRKDAGVPAMMTQHARRAIYQPGDATPRLLFAVARLLRERKGES